MEAMPGLNFRPGHGVQKAIFERFGCPVSPLEFSRTQFFLVASFGRCKFQLSKFSVGLLLQATIGGSASAFGVFHLAPRVFRFSVSSRSVGFHVSKLISFECAAYKVYFHLWSHGGPRWQSELAAFTKEEEDSWSEARKQAKGKAQRSFAEIVKSGILTGANSIPLRRSAFDRLIFPATANSSSQATATATVSRPTQAKVHWGSTVFQNCQKPGSNGQQTFEFEFKLKQWPTPNHPVSITQSNSWDMFSLPLRQTLKKPVQISDKMLPEAYC
ncbi:unnamed protein product [Miscanthus lutarioriparius]|uniref:Uncharacterized protein n=1 Tax=Miscanthus lutarioriparius TaxID=422564 RepID=A0A811MNJ3_9POAL|nr:unnamed protein product [Miscanthus lutarioriparius]